MFRLAHFSDIHLGPLPAVSYRQLVSKRVTGYINWHRHRRVSLDHGIIDQITEDMLEAGPDHIALTGDLVNLALDSEIAMARAWLEGLGPPDRISVVPGNHDAYVPRALRKACLAWSPWMTGDDTTPMASRHDFPYLRIRGPVALIGVSSARATAPFMASGHFTEPQARRLALLLDEAGRRGLFRVVMIHHPPVRGATGRSKRLFGIARFQNAVRRHGAELVLHGHTHLATVHWIAGPDGDIPVVGVAAAGQAAGGRKPPGHYNLFDISGEAGTWQVRHTRRGPTGPSRTMGEISFDMLVPGPRETARVR